MGQYRPISIGSYKILSVIGHGGMGAIYRGQDPLTARQVAIKTITQDFLRDTDDLQRLYFRFQQVGKLSHPNIIPVFQIGDIDEHFYVVMQLIEGETLDKLIRDGRRLPLLEKVDIIRQVAAGLGYAHSKGVIHDDVKPSAVMIRKGGNSLLNFSTLPCSLNLGRLIGFQAYLSPERIKGLPHDGRSDIFATGVVLFQLLTGSLPFGVPNDGVNYIMRMVNEKQPPLSDFLQKYPTELHDILDRSLAKDPAERYQTADEMAADLNSVVDTLKHEATEH